MAVNPAILIRPTTSLNYNLPVTLRFARRSLGPSYVYERFENLVGFPILRFSQIFLKLGGET
jgi:hypothetical protein